VALRAHGGFGSLERIAHILQVHLCRCRAVALVAGQGLGRRHRLMGDKLVSISLDERIRFSNVKTHIGEALFDSCIGVAGGHVDLLDLDADFLGEITRCLRALGRILDAAHALIGEFP